MPTMCAKGCGRQARPDRDDLCGTCWHGVKVRRCKAGCGRYPQSRGYCRLHQYLAQRAEEDDLEVRIYQPREPRYVTIAGEEFEITWP